MTPRSVSHPGSTADLQLCGNTFSTKERGLTFQGGISRWNSNSLSLESFGDGSGLLHAFVRKKNEKRGRSWKAAAHMNFMLDFLAKSLLLNMPCFCLCRLTSSPTLLLPAGDAQGNHGTRKEMGFWQTRRDTGDSRGAELLYEGETVAIQGDIWADKERQDFMEQPYIRFMQEVTDFHTEIP